MTIIIPLISLLYVLAYFGIGSVVGIKFAISYQSFVVILVLWPLFVLMSIISPFINWWVNRHLDY